MLALDCRGHGLELVRTPNNSSAHRPASAAADAGRVHTATVQVARAALEHLRARGHVRLLRPEGAELLLTKSN